MPAVWHGLEADGWYGSPSRLLRKGPVRSTGQQEQRNAGLNCGSCGGLRVGAGIPVRAFGVGRGSSKWMNGMQYFICHLLRRRTKRAICCFLESLLKIGGSRSGCIQSFLESGQEAVKSQAYSCLPILKRLTGMPAKYQWTKRICVICTMLYTAEKAVRSCRGLAGTCCQPEISAFYADMCVNIICAGDRKKLYRNSPGQSCG